MNDLNPSQYEEFVELSLSKLSLILSKLKAKELTRLSIQAVHGYNLNDNIKFIQDDNGLLSIFFI